MDYYAIKDLQGKQIKGGTFSCERDAIAWYLKENWGGWLYRKQNRNFIRVETEKSVYGGN